MKLSLLLVYIYLGSFSSKPVIGDHEQQVHVLILDKYELKLSFIQLKRFLHDYVKASKNGTPLIVITLNGSVTERFYLKKNEADESWIEKIGDRSTTHGVITYHTIKEAVSDIFYIQGMSGTPGIIALLVNNETVIDDEDWVKMATKNQKIQVVLQGNHTNRWTELSVDEGCFQRLGDTEEDVKNAVKLLNQSCFGNKTTQINTRNDYNQPKDIVIWTTVLTIINTVLIGVLFVLFCKIMKKPCDYRTQDRQSELYDGMHHVSVAMQAVDDKSSDGDISRGDGESLPSRHSGGSDAGIISTSGHARMNSPIPSL